MTIARHATPRNATRSRNGNRPLSQPVARVAAVTDIAPLQKNHPRWPYTQNDVVPQRTCYRGRLSYVRDLFNNAICTYTATARSIELAYVYDRLLLSSGHLPSHNTHCLSHSSRQQQHQQPTFSERHHYYLKVKVKADYSSSREPHLRATVRHLPYGITQCYLPSDTSERTRPKPSHAGWNSIYLPRRDGRLSWPSYTHTHTLLVDLIAPRPGLKPATFRSRVRRRTAAPPRQPICIELTTNKLACSVSLAVVNSVHTNVQRWTNSCNFLVNYSWLKSYNWKFNLA